MPVQKRIKNKNPQIIIANNDHPSISSMIKDNTLTCNCQEKPE